jgi:hypothetical protein
MTVWRSRNKAPSGRKDVIAEGLAFLRAPEFEYEKDALFRARKGVEDL